jgi:hypothetical protein
MSYHNTSSPTANAQRLTVNAQGQQAPAGYHYMPDGTLMSNAVMAPNKVIRNFDLNLSDIPYASEVRQFTISGDNGAQFILEIKSGSTFYNFTTNTFQAAASRLEKIIAGGSYKSSITFPTVVADGQYDIYLYAVPGTIHTAYSEVRFSDGSLDINASSGSNSLMLQKVIYQYATIDLTISGYSPNTTVSGASTPAVISTSRGKSKAKTPFSYVFTANSGSGHAVRVLKQPSSSDVLAFIEPVVGAAPVTLPGENIYPTVTATGKTNAVMSSTVTVTMLATIEDLGLKIGDKVIQATGPFFANIVTVVAVSGGGLSANQFTASEAISVGNDVRLNFYNQMNYSWPVTNFADKIKAGMIVAPSTNVTAGTVVGDYEDTIKIFEDTEKEQVIVKKKIQAVDTKAQKPTIVKGLVTVQPGDITFNKQQVLALAGLPLRVGGYGEGEISRVFGWDVRFTDLKVTLTAPTTTTTLATTTSTITVANTEGVINGVSRVKGIGINPALQNPLITGGGGTSITTGLGEWEADAAQTLENGITLTIENTGKIATITGNIEIIKAGTASQILRFDLEKFLSDTA